MALRLHYRRGMYGAPRKLCTDTVRQLCRVSEQLQPKNPIRLIVISTEGARPGLTERPGFTGPSAPPGRQRSSIGCM